MFKRSLLGAGIGGLYGGMSDGGSAAGGAIGGAAMGGLGVWGARKLTGNPATFLSRGSRAFRGLFDRTGLGWTAGGQRFRQGIGTANRWIANNQVSVNKWGGRALAGAGIASGAMIGSSIISSNNGF